MCGRMTLTVESYDALCEALGAEPVAAQASLHRPRYNVAPSDEHWVLRLDEAGRRLYRAVWGFPGKKNRHVINARSETAAAVPLFREAFRKRRCVVPADGFFEWKRQGSHRQPVWFHAPEGELLRLAGLWQIRGDGRMVFTILTTEANELIAPVHDRMPVILPKQAVTAWLEAPSRDLLVPYPSGELEATEVSTRVNHVANDDPGCIEPAQQQSLF